MYNEYTLVLKTRKEISSLDMTEMEIAEASLFVNTGTNYGVPFGKLMQNNMLLTKEDFIKFFTSVGATIYGQEAKAAEAEKSFGTVLELIKSSNSSGQA